MKSDLKKVLIITYYWPPSGGAGVQRWLKFTKYLPQNGWQPIVYTPENPENPIEDSSLSREIPQEAIVIKQPIWEPYSWYKRFVGKKPTEKINTGFLSENKKPGIAERMSVWVRGNFFIPDARCFWIKPSIRFLKKYLASNSVDAIISTGPPHSMHLIAQKVAKDMGIKWLADFRDPWTNIDFYPDLKLTKSSDNKHHQLERDVVSQCDRLVVVGQQMKDEFSTIRKSEIDVITNGYDTTDIDNKQIAVDDKFSIVHVGTIPPNRNPKVLWSVLSQMVINKEFAAHLEIKLIGKVDLSVLNDIEKAGLTPYLNQIPYLPHSEVFTHLRRAQLLMLAINNTPNAKGILTGKFFEYLAAKRPILAIGPNDGEVANILSMTKAGTIAQFDDEQTLRQQIEAYHRYYKQQNLNINSGEIEQYSRKKLTEKLSAILNDMVEDK